MKSENLHRHIAAMAQCFSDAGVDVAISTDADAYKNRVTDLLKYNLSTPLDPAYSKVGDGSLVWMDMRERGGFTVGIEVARVVRAPRWRGGLHRILRDQSLFATERPALPVISELPALNISGRIAWLGGGWINPDWRGRGLMSMAVKLIRAHALRLHDIDHAFAMLRANHLSLALSPAGYDFTNSAVVPNAYWSGSAAPEDLLLVSVAKSTLQRRMCGIPAYTLAAPPR